MNLKSLILNTIIIPSIILSPKNLSAMDFYLYANPLKSSYHTEDRDLNENNKIHGIGVKLNENFDIFAMRAINSHSHQTNWIGLNHKLCDDNLVKICGGYNFSIADGYPQNDFKPAPAIFFYLEAGYKKWGLEAFLYKNVAIWTFKYKIGEF